MQSGILKAQARSKLKRLYRQQVVLWLRCPFHRKSDFFFTAGNPAGWAAVRCLHWRIAVPFIRIPPLCAVLISLHAWAVNLPATRIPSLCGRQSFISIKQTNKQTNKGNLLQCLCLRLERSNAGTSVGSLLSNQTTNPALIFTHKSNFRRRARRAARRSEGAIRGADKPAQWQGGSDRCGVDMRLSGKRRDRPNQSSNRSAL